MTIKKSPNTECVYETIGNYPVVDQFDVLYGGMLSGTYMDNYITGSLLTFNPFLGTLEQGERGLAFSKLDENKGYPVDITNVNNWTGYNLQSWSERAGTVRNTRIFSSSERYYDSQTPTAIEIINNLGGVSDIYGAYTITVGSPTSIADGFTESFPFESKFSNVPRITKSPILKLQYGLGPVRWEFLQNTLLTTIETTSKVCFGFGDKNDRFYDAGIPGWVSSKNLVEFRESFSFSGNLVGYSPVLRGWKYGLVDGNPHYTSTVFRRDRYGQFRDILEQRRSVTSIIDPANSPTKYFGSAEKPALTPAQFDEMPSFFYDPPVKVSFVKPDVVANKLVYLSQEPETTWSSNVSFYATSSIPYFDGEAKNRGPITTNIVSSSITFTITSDPFKNLTLLQSV
jgi:hypothetical protein